MKAEMKKALCILFLSVWSVAAFAQESVRVPQRMELAAVDVNDGESMLQVFSLMKEEGENGYYLSVGHLGVGDEVIQIQFDPLFELFIPLGGTLAEAMDTLARMQALFKSGAGSFIELQGCLALALPTDEYETVKITYRRPLLTRMLVFGVERDGLLRATHVTKSDFGSLMSALKFYRMVHPTEE